MQYPLTLALRSARPDLVIGAEEMPALEASLSRVVQRAHTRWPPFGLSAQLFVAFLAAKVESPIGAIIDTLQIEDLYLACACLNAVPAAMVAFEGQLMPVAKRAVLSIDAPQATRDEVVQSVRARLLVGAPERPATLHQYAGRGSLEGWVRVTAVRLALNMLRKTKREVSVDDSVLVSQVAENDAELELVRVRYQPELEQAMQRAFERLADDQRELLRLYVVDGLTLDELGRAHDVNPATVSRWLKRIRDKIASDARGHFAERCGLDDSECESVMRAVKSGMHVSVARLLDAGS